MITSFIINYYLSKEFLKVVINISLAFFCLGFIITLIEEINFFKDFSVGIDVPLIDGVSLYGKKYDGDWEDTTGYGVKVDKSGQLGNFDYNVLANIDQDKKANIGLDLSKELEHLPGSEFNIKTDWNTDDDRNIWAGVTIPWGDSEKYKKRKSPINYEKSLIGGHVWQDGELVERSEQEQLQDKINYENCMNSQTYGFNEPSEALEFAKEKKILAKGGRVRMASGGIVNLLKL